MTLRDAEVRRSRQRRVRTWRRVVVVLSMVSAVVILLTVSRSAGATYEEYLRLREGMRRAEVAAIIGADDFWHHREGDLDVTSWVNEDGTYIRAVFDRNDVLVEVSWESGWDPAWERD